MLGLEVMQSMNVIRGIAKQTDKATTPEQWVAQLSDRLALTRHEVRKKFPATLVQKKKKDYDVAVKESVEKSWA